MNDEIVDDVRRKREEILHWFGSPESYFKHVVNTQSKYGVRLVSREPKRTLVKQNARGQHLPLTQ